MHVGREDPARRDGLADGLVVAVVAPDDHLVRHPGQRRDVAPVLVQQEGQVLARLEVLLLDDVVVPRERVDLRVVVRGGLHHLPADDVLPLPHVMGQQVGKQAGPDPGRGVVVLVHKVHEVLRRVVLLPGTPRHNRRARKHKGREPVAGWA